MCQSNYIRGADRNRQFIVHTDFRGGVTFKKNELFEKKKKKVESVIPNKQRKNTLNRQEELIKVFIRNFFKKKKIIIKATNGFDGTCVHGWGNPKNSRTRQLCEHTKLLRGN